MTEESTITAPAVKRKRRSQAQIEAELRARITAEVKADLAATPATMAVMAAAAIAAVEKDINKKVHEAPNVTEERMWIILGESKYIRRGEGQFFGVNGRGYLLKPGKKAYVPKGIVDILDHAVEDVPDVDPDTLVISGWKQQLRFPYSLTTPGP